MTIFVPAEPGKRMLVMMPDGYRVWPDAHYDQYKDDATFFQLSVAGIGENGERVTVRGNHIARVQLAVAQPKPLETEPAAVLATALRDLRDAFAPTSLPETPLWRNAMTRAWYQANSALREYDRSEKR